MLKLIGAAVLAGVTLFLSVACSGGGDDRAGQLVVGMDLRYPPYETTTAEGEPTGVSVEMAEALAAELGRELVLEDVPFDGLITALKSGKIDLIISSMTANEVRRESIDFSDPYARTQLAILAAKESPVQSFQDLNDPSVKVVAQLGTTGELYIKAEVPDAEHVVLDDGSACVMEIVQGKSDAFVFDQLTIYRHHQRHPETTRALLDNFQEEYWAVGIAKGNDGLRAEVNAFIASYAEAGGFVDLGAKYLAEEKALLEEMRLPFLLLPPGGWGE